MRILKLPTIRNVNISYISALLTFSIIDKEIYITSGTRFLQCSREKCDYIRLPSEQNSVYLPSYRFRTAEHRKVLCHPIAVT